jgi:hypothetical protein
LATQMRGLTAAPTPWRAGRLGKQLLIDLVSNDASHADGVNTIDIHRASYWVATNPSAIAMYRLDPDHQYLIQGTSLGQVIQGSVYNNLSQPGGGADIMTSGQGNNEIQDTTAHLNGITVTDFQS